MSNDICSDEDIETRYLVCQISRRGLPCEGSYHVVDVGGNWHSGVADINYLMHLSADGWTTVKSEAELTKKKLNGMVLVRDIREEGDGFLVELPDGNQCVVDAGLLVSDN